MFFIHVNKQNAGVLGWPLKLLQSPYSKVRLTSSLPLRPNGRIFLAFNAPSQFFLRESRKAAAWWEHCRGPSWKPGKGDMASSLNILPVIYLCLYATTEQVNTSD